MWLLELIAISIIGGVIGGLGWRLVDEWSERRQLKKAENAFRNS